MKKNISSSVIAVLLIIGLTTVVFNIQPLKSQATSITSAPSLQLLGGAAKWAARDGATALFVNWKDNWLAHHLTDGASWGPWPTEQWMDNTAATIIQTLNESGFTVERAGDIPADLSGYSLVVLQAYWAAEPRYEPLIRNYILNGGGVVVFEGVAPYFVVYCKDWWPYRLGGDNLAPIQDWFGAGHYWNDHGTATLAVDYPFGLPMRQGDSIYQGTGNLAMVTMLQSDTTLVANWNSGSAFATAHEYGLGRVYFQAAYYVAPTPPPPPTTWSVTISTTPDGTGSTSPYGLITVTGTLIATATPNTGYQFHNWVFDSMNYGTSNPITIPQQAEGTSHTLTAVFTEKIEPPPPPPPPPVYTDVLVVNPQTGDQNFVFYDNTTSVGTRFNATVWVHDVTDLFAYQVYLRVDDSVLSITRVWMPDWDASWVFYGESVVSSPRLFFDGDADGSVEAVLFGDALLGPDQPRFTGTGLLAIVEFEIIKGPAEGNLYSALDIGQVNPYATFVLDSSSAEIPCNKINGQYAFYDPPLLLGDLTRDGKVDIKDLAIAGKAFGSYPGHSRWNAIADVNGDGKVDIIDMAMIAKNYGKQLP